MNRTWQAFVIIMGVILIVTIPVTGYEANGVNIDWDGDTLDLDTLGEDDSGPRQPSATGLSLDWDGGFLDLGVFGQQQQQQQGAAGQQQQQQGAASGPESDPDDAQEVETVPSVTPAGTTAAQEVETVPSVTPAGTPIETSTPLSENANTTAG